MSAANSALELAIQFDLFSPETSNNQPHQIGQYFDIELCKACFRY